MNFVEINGGNKTQREICEKVVGHMISKLLSRFRTLDITVNLVNIKSEAVGFCMKWFMSNSLQEKKWLMVLKLVLQDGSLRQYLWILTIGICLGKRRHIEWKRNLQIVFGKME